MKTILTLLVLLALSISARAATSVWTVFRPWPVTGGYHINSATGCTTTTTGTTTSANTTTTVTTTAVTLTSCTIGTDSTGKPIPYTQATVTKTGLTYAAWVKQMGK